jgi:tellurite resistance protein TehA-like permease
MNPSEGPIDPFPTPDFFNLGTGSLGTSSLNIPFNFSAFLPVIFAVAFFIWTAYTIIVAYHWFRYGHRSLLAIPMLAVHVGVSGVLLLLTVAGLR